jgi:hypothetical protein
VNGDGSIRPNLPMKVLLSVINLCLVMKGFSQQEGINYTETFSPIAKMNYFRLIFSLAAHFG